jgi:hypothetical protein
LLIPDLQEVDEEVIATIFLLELPTHVDDGLLAKAGCDRN